jgi:glucose-6-phosphate isomerase
MPYQQQIDSCFRETIDGAGITRAELKPFVDQAAGALQAIKARRAELPLWQLPARRDDLVPLVEPADAFARFETVVLFGTGGSSLGGQALAELALASNGLGHRPRLVFVDSLPAQGMLQLFAGLKLEQSGFIVVSKSGSTAETMAQILVAIGEIKTRLGEAAVARHVIGVAEPGDNALRRLAARHGFRMLDHDPKIGGRFSVLSVTGMLPASILGLDILAIRGGAAQVLEASFEARNPTEAAPVVGAALNVALQRRRGIHATVLLAYAAQLERFTAWHRQLWAESLGKEGEGTLPAPAMGPVDQHSQLQLYLGGPADKFFTVFLPKLAGIGQRIDVGLAGNDPALMYLHGRSIGDLVDAEGRATAETLAKRGRPTRIIRIERVDERTLGALFMHFMLETVIAAHLLGVDAFDQPAVEEGKMLARRYLAAMQA